MCAQPFSPVPPQVQVAPPLAMKRHLLFGRRAHQKREGIVRLAESAHAAAVKDGFALGDHFLPVALLHNSLLMRIQYIFGLEMKYPFLPLGIVRAIWQNVPETALNARHVLHGVRVDRKIRW